MAEVCGRCNRSLGGLIGVKAADAKLLAEYAREHPGTADALCASCLAFLTSDAGKEALAAMERKKEQEQARQELLKGRDERLESMSISTLPALPPGYRELGIATGHVALGTGIISEFLSIFTDTVGAQSQTYNDKIRTAEELCMDKLRQNAADMGADKVVGVHMTYTELTMGRGMLMVCMSGTAIQKES